MTFLDLAVLGTSRQQGGVPETGTPVDALAASAASGGVERSVLLRAGALAVYGRAGRRPDPGIRPPAIAPADRLPEPSSQVTRLLRELTQDGPRDVLGEALNRLRHAGCRLPAGLLPALLDLKDDSLSNAIAPVLGERGRWLARFRPEWSWVVAGPVEGATIPADADRTWEEGAFDARLALLRGVRRAEPERARAWVEAVWTQEKSEQRVELLKQFAVGLSAADEAFLESALDDRSQVVRTTAAELLATLPDSALGRRVAERASALLEYMPPTGGAWTRVRSAIGGGPPVGVLNATPPHSVDASWTRDGVPPKPPKGMGERAHWLAALLALVPPARWEQRLGGTPVLLVPAAWAGEWGFAIALGWSRAALLHHQTTWAAPLWDGWKKAKLEGAQADVQREMLEVLLRHMDQGDAESRVLSVAGHHPLLALQLSVPWSAGFGSRYLDLLEHELRARQPTLHLSDTTMRAAIALPPDCFSRALDLAALAPAPDEGYSPWRKPLQTFIEVLTLRRRIYQEIPT